MNLIDLIDPADKKPRLSKKYAFEKPNDRRALDLMNEAARAVMRELPDICMAYGISDEYRCLSGDPSPPTFREAAKA